MSFLEDCVRFGDQLARLVDAGVPVKEAAVAVGVSRERCYAILRAIDRPVGQAGGRRQRADQSRVAEIDVIVAVFTDTGSILQAAKACGVSHSTARKLAFDRGALERALDAASQLDAAERSVVGQTLIDAAAQMSAEGRRRMAGWRPGPDGPPGPDPGSR